MPAAKAGESKQALVVTLVVFILLSIILGIMTYVGWDGRNTSDKQRDEALRDAKKEKDEALAKRAIALVFRSYAVGSVKDPKELPLLYEQASKAKDDDGNVEALAKLEKEFG